MVLLRKLRHKHIVAYLGCEMTDSATFTVFMEYVPGGDVATVLSVYGALADGVVALYTRQILQGLAYLHENKIIHRGRSEREREKEDVEKEDEEKEEGEGEEEEKKKKKKGEERK